MKLKINEENLDYSAMLGILFIEAGLFCIDLLSEDDPEPGQKKIKTTAPATNCNDLFYYACADYEFLERKDIPVLYKMWKEDPRWGIDKWSCQKRNLRPLKPTIKRMKQDGVWDDKMKALPPK